MENHQGCKMKFRNQLAVNLVKLLVPTRSHLQNGVDPVGLAFNLADRVAARIQHDNDIEYQKAADKSLAEIRAHKAAASAGTNQAKAPVDYAAEVSAPVEPEERRFFLITNEGQLFPKQDESFEAFLTRALFNLEGK